YNGLEQTSTNELNQTKTVRNDGLGRLVEATDDLSNSITFVYDAAGQLIETHDPSTNVITTAYDIRGNKTATTDPDKGAWTYRYNALGLLVEQTDAKGQMTAFTYDELGRVLTRIDDSTAPNPSERTATWTYDTAIKGVGKLHQVAMPNYDAVNGYDAFGRPEATTETIDGTAYTVSTTFDAFSRVADIVYPSGLTARNLYNAQGHLESVTNAATGDEYWTALAQDERGNISHFRLGNGVESLRTFDRFTGFLDAVYSTDATQTTILQDLDYNFDAFGNLARREDVEQGLVEDFVYDTLNRVVQTDTTVPDPGGGAPILTTVTVGYDALGNITNKSDVGAYTYGQAHAGCASGHAGPHAVTTV
ncbi:MAG: RHS repeat protein, partial [bacterium]|nr:RHS repeat protein [bacterium]